MYSLRLTCPAEDVDRISGELWEAGTIGIFEADDSDGIVLTAGFETNELRTALLAEFNTYTPRWQQEQAIDWVHETHRAWPARVIGDQLFLAPPWSEEATPPGRKRVIHNPGLACGTGEHPCSQLALIALERCVRNGCRVADIGTGSAILTIAALKLGAESAIGIDTDEAALAAARDNFELNGLQPVLAAGSADCLADSSADITVANINGTVLLHILDELVRIGRRGGWLILTGFPESEAAVFTREFPNAEVSAIAEWRCLTVRIS